MAQGLGSAGLRLGAKAARRPIDSLAIAAAMAASLVIVVNALFLQSGAHRSPFLDNPLPPPATADARPTMWDPVVFKPAQQTQPAPNPAGMAAPDAAAARHDDPIADLIGPSPRIRAVQRALSQYGYGQIKASGTLDNATSAAIEKFQREHKLPVTGEVSDRLVSELAAMTGHRPD